MLSLFKKKEVVTVSASDLPVASGPHQPATTDNPFDFGIPQPKSNNKRKLPRFIKLVPFIFAAIIIAIGAVVLCMYLQSRCGEAADGTYLASYRLALQEVMEDGDTGLLALMESGDETFPARLCEQLTERLNFQHTFQTAPECPLPIDSTPWFNYKTYGQDEHEYYLIGNRDNDVVTVWLYSPGEDGSTAVEWHAETGFNGLPAGSYACTKKSDDAILTVKMKAADGILQMAYAGSFEDDSDEKFLSYDRYRIMTIEEGFFMPWMHTADKAAKNIVDSASRYEFAVNADGKEADTRLMNKMDKNKVIIWFGNGFTVRPYGTCVAIGEDANQNAAITSNDEVVDIGGKAFLTSKFIEHNFPDNSFTDAVIFIGASNPGTNFAIPNAFVAKGAACVFAFNGDVSSSYARKMCAAVMDSMATGSTAAEALEAAKQAVGPVDPTNSTTALVIVGEHTSRLAGYRAGTDAQ